MAGEKAKENLTVRISPFLRARIEAYAAELKPRASMGAVVRLWLEEKADEVEKKRRQGK